MSDASSNDCGSRRDFLQEGLSIAIGGAVVAVPAVAGLVAWSDPLRRVTGVAGFVKVATLDALPADGIPRRFAVVADKVDAWTRMPSVPVGAVYLRRTAEKVIAALNTVCPHAGCAVDYQSARGCYFCPCHNSTFGVDGSINDPNSPSPRAMDSLEVDLRGNEVWVRFQNFQAGHADKRPV